MRTFKVVDSHTGGEPTRIVVSGIPEPAGNSMREKMQYFRDHHDHLRRALMWEPRGHRDMFGAILTTPCDRRAQIGAIFVDCDGYLTMCGHGSIGVVTMALEGGLLPQSKPAGGWFLDTPAGLVSFDACVESGKVEQVAIENVPSFLFRSGVEVPLGGERVRVDIAYGGNWFGLVDVRQLRLQVRVKDLPALTDAGARLLSALRRSVRVEHPQFGQSVGVDLLELYEEDLEAVPRRNRNVVVFASGQYDRSPCGTGTCAKMAALHSSGLLRLHEPYLSESITNQVFRGDLVAECRLGPLTAVVPRITGSAWITGYSELVIDPRDPLAEGFLCDEYHGRTGGVR